MRKPENTWITGMHKHLPSPLELYRVKMANPYVGGLPDWFYSGCRADLWCEYKYLPKLPVRARIAPALSALQLDWLTKRRAEGRHCLAAVGCKEGGVFYPDPHTWVDGLSPEQFCSALLSRAEFAARLVAHCNEGQLLC